jgi:signal transduction histidine kinase
LAVPVKRDVRVIGVINLESDAIDAFGEHEQALVSRLADHAAIAIENARLYDELRRAHASKGEFVSLISHELKAPMTIIKGYSELMQLTLHDQLGAENAQLLDITMSNVEQMQTLIDDLLQLAQLESGALTLDRQPTHVHTVLGDAMASFRHTFDERALNVSWEIAPDVPPVDADPIRLRQILTNLISNAVKYTPREGEIVISVAGERITEVGVSERRYVRCSVRDSGVGISTDDQVSLFGQFFRADNPVVRRQTGTGLGLSITKTLVQMHGGQIGVESTLGQGSTFWFTVPVADSSAPRPTPTP